MVGVVSGSAFAVMAAYFSQMVGTTVSPAQTSIRAKWSGSY